MRKVERPRNELYLSPISTGEAQYATAKSRRIKLNRQFHEWLEQSMQTAEIQEAPFPLAVAAEDDLLLAATAVVHGLTLATAGEQRIRCWSVKALAHA